MKHSYPTSSTSETSGTGREERYSKYGSRYSANKGSWSSKTGPKKNRYLQNFKPDWEYKHQQDWEYKKSRGWNCQSNSDQNYNNASHLSNSKKFDLSSHAIASNTTNPTSAGTTRTTTRREQLLHELLSSPTEEDDNSSTVAGFSPSSPSPDSLRKSSHHGDKPLPQGGRGSCAQPSPTASAADAVLKTPSSTTSPSGSSLAGIKQQATSTSTTPGAGASSAAKSTTTTATPAIQQTPGGPPGVLPLSAGAFPPLHNINPLLFPQDPLLQLHHQHLGQLGAAPAASAYYSYLAAAQQMLATAPGGSGHFAAQAALLGGVGLGLPLQLPGKITTNEQLKAAQDKDFYRNLAKGEFPEDDYSKAQRDFYRKLAKGECSGTGVEVDQHHVKNISGATGACPSSLVRGVYQHAELVHQQVLMKSGLLLGDHDQSKANRADPIAEVCYDYLMAKINKTVEENKNQNDTASTSASKVDKKLRFSNKNPRYHYGRIPGLIDAIGESAKQNEEMQLLPAPGSSSFVVRGTNYKNQQDYYSTSKVLQTFSAKIMHFIEESEHRQSVHDLALRYLVFVLSRDNRFDVKKSANWEGDVLIRLNIVVPEGEREGEVLKNGNETTAEKLVGNKEKNEGSSGRDGDSKQNYYTVPTGEVRGDPDAVADLHLYPDEEISKIGAASSSSSNTTTNSSDVPSTPAQKSSAEKVLAPARDSGSAAASAQRINRNNSSSCPKTSSSTVAPCSPDEDKTREHKKNCHDIKVVQGLSHQVVDSHARTAAGPCCLALARPTPATPAVKKEQHQPVQENHDDASLFATPRQQFRLGQEEDVEKIFGTEELFESFPFNDVDADEVDHVEKQEFLSVGAIIQPISPPALLAPKREVDRAASSSAIFTPSSPGSSPSSPTEQAAALYSGASTTSPSSNLSVQEPQPASTSCTFRSQQHQRDHVEMFDKQDLAKLHLATTAIFGGGSFADEVLEVEVADAVLKQMQNDCKKKSNSSYQQYSQQKLLEHHYNLNQNDKEFLFDKVKAFMLENNDICRGTSTSSSTMDLQYGLGGFIRSEINKISDPQLRMSLMDGDFLKLCVAKEKKLGWRICERLQANSTLHTTSAFLGEDVDRSSTSRVSSTPASSLATRVEHLCCQVESAGKLFTTTTTKSSTGPQMKKTTKERSNSKHFSTTGGAAEHHQVDSWELMKLKKQWFAKLHLNATLLHDVLPACRRLGDYLGKDESLAGPQGGLPRDEKEGTSSSGCVDLPSSFRREVLPKLQPEWCASLQLEKLVTKHGGNRLRRMKLEEAGQRGHQEFLKMNHSGGTRMLLKPLPQHPPGDHTYSRSTSSDDFDYNKR
ncbi:unnamed protein product [Amoebophrya sp. A120]|nr:unnamed protein product [Amoebophrya sp. A120]|eukprot:GSA120T00006855001.1